MGSVPSKLGEAGLEFSRSDEERPVTKGSGKAGPMPPRGWTGRDPCPQSRARWVPRPMESAGDVVLFSTLGWFKVSSSNPETVEYPNIYIRHWTRQNREIFLSHSKSYVKVY